MVHLPVSRGANLASCPVALKIQWGSGTELTTQDDQNQKEQKSSRKDADRELRRMKEKVTQIHKVTVAALNDTGNHALHTVGREGVHPCSTVSWVLGSEKQQF